jgi:hypothetical protein
MVQQLKIKVANENDACDGFRVQKFKTYKDKKYRIMETKQWGQSILNNWERTIALLELRESLKMLHAKEHVYVLITTQTCHNTIILKAQYFKRDVDIISIFLYKEGCVFNVLQNDIISFRTNLSIAFHTSKWNTFFFGFTGM